MRITNLIELQGVIEKLSKACLTPTEFKVVLSWMTDSAEFHTSQSVYAERVGISRNNVNRAFQGLLNKKILTVNNLKPSGKGKAIPMYELHPEFCQLEQAKVPALTKPEKSLDQPVLKPESIEVDTLNDMEDQINFMINENGATREEAEEYIRIKK